MRIFVTLLQLALAVAAGYFGGRLAQSPAPSLPVIPPPAATIPQVPPAPALAPPDRANSAPSAGSPTAAALSTTYRTAVERAAPAVLTIHSARTASRGPLGFGGRELLSQGLGSGVLIDDKGHVVTNAHVVQGANEIMVALPDGTRKTAKLRGVDPESDLAVLAVDANGLQPIALGNSKDLAVGDVVLAVGNPLGVGQTVTQGIVSAVGRRGLGINPIENFIQTDAAINPGNSGGALIDTAGRLIGINTAILSSGGGSEGLGFAIPVDLVQQVVASLVRTGRVNRGYLGVSTEPAPRGRRGATIVAVQRDGPADRAGLTPGDVVVQLGNREILEPRDLVGATLEHEPGNRVAVQILRDGRRETREVELGRRPPLRRQERLGR
ncbi:MAG TPA: trypsin-like peptidase domain-containing protein [Casimicrobiaceae bacterium]|nr:trypsin-like peptidase domain-containing protein [Casimicrobiaceae bacterium]